MKYVEKCPNCNTYLVIYINVEEKSKLLKQGN